MDVPLLPDFFFLLFFLQMGGHWVFSFGDLPGSGADMQLREGVGFFPTCSEGTRFSISLSSDGCFCHVTVGALGPL